MKRTSIQIDDELKEAGYKFLGWLNGWSVIWFDRAGNQVEGGRSDAVSFDYDRKDNPPEYFTCRDAGHKTDEVQHNLRGSENTVSCDICRIYWKYDCSD